MWSTIGRCRHRYVAGLTFYQHPFVSLVLGTVEIIIDLAGWKFRMSGTVTCFAIHTAVSSRKPIQRQTRCGRIRGGRKGLIYGLTHVTAVIIYACVSDLSIVLRRCSSMTALTVGFVQPARTICAAHHAHRSVAALALHKHSAIGGDSTAYDPAQTSGF